MFITNSNHIPNTAFEVIGPVYGNALKSKNLLQIIFLKLQVALGLLPYGLMDGRNHLRQQAKEAMIIHANTLQADAIIAYHCSLDGLMPGLTEGFAYGTAVRFI